MGIDHIHRRDVEQRCVNAYFVSRLMHATVEHVPRGAGRRVSARLGAGIDHGQLRDPRQPVDEVTTDDGGGRSDDIVRCSVVDGEHRQRRGFELEHPSLGSRIILTGQIRELVDVDLFRNVLQTLLPDRPKAEGRLIEEAIDAS